MYPAIMRFTTLDPLAEKYYSISPYAYCGNNPVIYIDQNGLWPTRKVVDNDRVGSRGFSLNPVMNPYHKIKRPHYGQDFPASEGNNIHALATGIVTNVGYDKGGWGYYVDIKHSNGYASRSAHLQKNGIKVKIGDKIVADGEIIALSGMTRVFCIINNIRIYYGNNCIIWDDKRGNRSTSSFRSFIKRKSY
jgi:hypothetical protein